MAKQLSYEQVERKKDQAAELMRRTGDSDRADMFEGMSVPEYAEHRGLEISSNPNRRRNCMAGNGSPTKSDLQDMLDQVQSILQEAYQPESDRETMASAIGDALDALSGPEDEDEDLEDEDLDDDANGD